jgi:SAM-dependent methyltransferase
VLGGGTSPPPAGPRRVGLIGLGAGTLAAYARAGDVYRFYEINPAVLRVAQEAFTYLGDAKARGATIDVVFGDGRLSLEREPDQQFDALVLDAFSADAIPVHLLTTEAFELYRRHLKPGGVLCVHVSNHYLDLDVVTAAAAARMGWKGLLIDTDYDGDANFPAVWVLLGPDAAALARFHVADSVELPPAPPDFRPWTDEHASVLRVLRKRYDAQ